jgi:hypothetical protein
MRFVKRFAQGELRAARFHHAAASASDWGLKTETEFSLFGVCALAIQ